MIFQIENKNVYASDAGQDIDKKKDTIVFLHGSGLSHIVWSLTEQYLSNQGYNVLALDLPGHGNSKGDSLSSIEKIAEWLEKAINKIGINEFSILTPISSNSKFPNWKNKITESLVDNEPFEVETIDGYSMLINKKKFNENYFDENNNRENKDNKTNF